jgi:hypothetical protein
MFSDLMYHIFTSNLWGYDGTQGDYFHQLGVHQLLVPQLCEAVSLLSDTSPKVLERVGKPRPDA